MAPRKKKKPDKVKLSPEEKAYKQINWEGNPPVLDRRGVNQIPEGWGRDPISGNPQTSGFVKPDPVSAQFEATKQFGALKASEDITRAGIRLEEHHIILQKLLEPFVEGRSIQDADEILKQVSKNLGGRPLGNNPGNLISLVKELHIKGELSAHGILKRYYDFQGAKQFIEYDQMSKFPKIHGDVDFGQKFGNWYQLTNMQDGWSLDMIEAIQKMPKNKAADILTGYLELSIPRLEGAALAALWLDPTARRNDVALREMNKMPNGKRHLMETLSDIKLQELQTWNKTAPGKIAEGLTKGEQSALHKKSQQVWNALNSFNEDAAKYGLSQIELSDIQKGVTPAELKPGPARTNIPKTREQLLDEALKREGYNPTDWVKRSENARAARAIGGVNTLNAAIGDGTMALHAGLPIADVEGMAKKAADMAWDFGEKGRDMNLAALDNLRAPMALSEGATVAGKLARKAGALVPFAGAAFDTIDAADKLRRARQDPTFLNNLQATMAVGTVGTSFWNEPTNFALGIGNLGIDVGRGVHGLVTDEEKREEAINMLNALGQSSFKALGLLKY